MQYGADATEQGWNEPLGRVMLALAEGIPIAIAAINKRAEVALARIEVRFMYQNYRLPS
jgi:hypothetical protein